jgi:hypothetical protein
MRLNDLRIIFPTEYAPFNMQSDEYTLPVGKILEVLLIQGVRYLFASEHNNFVLI